MKIKPNKINCNSIYLQCHFNNNCIYNIQNQLIIYYQEFWPKKKKKEVFTLAITAADSAATFQGQI